MVKKYKGITQRADGLYMGRFEYHGEKFAVYDKSLKEVQKKLNDLRYGTWLIYEKVKSKPERLV